jgi:hypothetical protein
MKTTHLRFIISIIAYLNISLVFCQTKKIKPAVEYVTTLKNITNVMVNDVTSPVAAARYYGYITLTAYEVLSVSNALDYPSMSTVLKFPEIKISDAVDIKKIDPAMAVNLAMLKAAEKLLPSGPTLSGQISQYIENYHVPTGKSETGKHSLALAGEVADQIVRWARTDGFQQLNNLERYTPKSDPGNWKPTAPAFMAPIEPQWRTIRPFLMDSAQQFKPKLPAPYSTEKNSSFYQQMLETYEVGNRADKKEQEIAMFWDCNPFAVQQIGHVEFGLKKISPGGHWIGITGIACKKKKMDLGHIVLTHAIVGITMHDAFIACWDEKYRSDRVRPETAINLLLDPRWRPLLQTPPFPEYVSGHSVVSSASAQVLTAIFGPKLSFTDDTEIEFGLSKRKFRSFIQAAEEASISRLYGGIHYRDGIDQGVWQGKEVGKLSISKLKKYYQLISRQKQ